jgi:RNA polymerase sigma-70 factor, ECF subfamily
VEARSETSDAVATEERPLSFEAIFDLYYERITHAIARVVGDRACAEELAVDVFWKLWRNPKAVGEKAGGWLYRTGIHLAIGELRRRARHARYERLLRLTGPTTPEQIQTAEDERQQVRRVLAAIRPRDAELLLLRNNDLSYEEIAAAMRINSASVGTLIRRARETFRKEYVKLYGEHRN